MSQITRVLGVYHADTGLKGHLRYIIDRVARGEGCALCDITHGLVREKGEFAECRQQFPVPVEVIYRNQMSPAMVETAGGQTPVVLGETAAGYVVLLDAAALEAVGGEVYRFRAALEAAMAEARVQVPA